MGSQSGVRGRRQAVCFAISASARKGMRVVAPFMRVFACGVAGLAVEALALFGCAYPEEAVGAEVEVCSAATEVERGHCFVDAQAEYLAFVWLYGDAYAEPFLRCGGRSRGRMLLRRRRMRVRRLRGLRLLRGRHLSAIQLLCLAVSARRCALRRRARA